MLARLKIENLRCVAHAEFNLQPGVNFLLGGNGSGKTTVLEAIFVLSRGRSFRSRSSWDMVGPISEFAAVAAVLSTPTGSVNVLRAHAARDRLACFIDDEAVVTSTVSQRLPVFFLNFNWLGGSEGGPRTRRKILDWGVFLSEPSFYGVWLRYMRALKQRNAAVRRANNPEISLWEAEASGHGERLNELRERYLKTLSTCFQEVFEALGWSRAVEIRFARGWSASSTLEDCLCRARAGKDLLGIAAPGPHRADFSITLEPKDHRGALSRGQGKMLMLAFQIAQAKVAARRMDDVCILFDDFGAELDRANRAIALSMLGELALQVIVASSELDRMELNNEPVFHVEHGAIRIGSPHFSYG